MYAAMRSVLTRKGASRAEKLEALEEVAPEILRRPWPEVLLQDQLETLLQLDHRGYPWTRLLAGVVSARTNNAAVAKELIEQSVRSFRRSKDRRGEAAALLALGNLELSAGDFRASHAYWFQADTLARDSTLVRNFSNLVFESYLEGDAHRCRQIADEALVAAHRAGQPDAEAMSCICQAIARVLVADFPGAEDMLDRAAAALAQVEEPTRRHMLLPATRGVVLIHRGELEEGAEHLDAAIEMTSSLGETRLEAWVLAESAERLADHDPERRLEDARRAVSLAEQVGWDWLIDRAVRAEAVVRARLSERGPARECLTELMERELAPIDRASTLLELGRIDGQTGDTSAAITALEEASELCASMGVKLVEAQATAMLAAVDEARRDHWCERLTELIPDEMARFWLDRALACGGETRERIEITLLGAPSIRVAGEQVQFPTRASEVLIYALALAPEGASHRDELVEILWPGGSAEPAAGRLRTELWRARKALGPAGGHLQRKGAVVRIDTKHLVVDVLELRAEAEQVLDGRRELRPGLVDALEATIALPWRYEDWAIAERRLNETLVAALRTSRDGE